MIIAGIDPSMTPGVCIMDKEKILFVTQETGLKPKPQYKGHVPNPALFNVNFENWLHAVLIANSVTHVAYELPIPAGQIASKSDVHELAGYMKRFTQGLCARTGLEFHGVHIQSWRSFFIGKTQAPKAPEPPDHILPHRGKAWQSNWRKGFWKEAAIKRCAGIGLELKSHDAAESVGVAAWLHGQMFSDSWLRSNDLFSGEMTSRIDGKLSLTKKPFLTPKIEKTKTEIMAEAESLFKK